MAGNSIGQLFRVTTCGESHGVGLIPLLMVYHRAWNFVQKTCKKI